MTELVKSEPTEVDKELIEKANAKKEQFKTDMIKYKHIYLTDESNDYPFFLYLASIMNFVEYHNGGCLTEWGMKSLELDISPYIHKLQTGSDDYKLGQKDLVRFLLNLLNSYATTILCTGLFEFAKEDPEKFFELNDFPEVVKDDFEKLEKKSKEVADKLKKVLDIYSTYLDGKYKRIFLEEKTKGFVKPIFDPNAVKISKRFPTGLENAKECK